MTLYHSGESIMAIYVVLSLHTALNIYIRSQRVEQVQGGDLAKVDTNMTEEENIGGEGEMRAVKLVSSRDRGKARRETFEWER